MRAIVIAAALAGLAVTPARAELGADKMNAARATVEQYGKEMTDFLPCAYIGFIDSKGTEDFAETNYGLTAVSAAIGKFIGENQGTLAQAAELAAVYAASAKPMFERDIRELTRFCKERKLIEQMYTFSGASIPLGMRAPFNGH